MSLIAFLMARIRIGNRSDHCGVYQVEPLGSLHRRRQNKLFWSRLGGIYCRGAGFSAELRRRCASRNIEHPLEKIVPYRRWRPVH